MCKEWRYASSAGEISGRSAVSPPLLRPPGPCGPACGIASVVGLGACLGLCSVRLVGALGEGVHIRVFG